MLSLLHGTNRRQMYKKYLFASSDVKKELGTTKKLPEC